MIHKTSSNDLDYDPRKDAHDSYFVAIEAKRLRGDHLPPIKPDMSRVEALERNLLSLERLVHGLQRQILNIEKALLDD